eukprot:scaffold20193_cov18-Tisochrysis_lutea.AAC.2
MGGGGAACMKYHCAPRCQGVDRQLQTCVLNGLHALKVKTFNTQMYSEMGLSARALLKNEMESLQSQTTSNHIRARMPFHLTVPVLKFLM